MLKLVLLNSLLLLLSVSGFASSEDNILAKIQKKKLCGNQKIHESQTFFANFYTTVDQFLAINAPIVFENRTLSNGVLIACDNATIIFAEDGFYSITYTATGVPPTPIPVPTTQTLLPWSLALFMNEGCVKGGVTNIISGSLNGEQGVIVNTDDIFVLGITGQVIIAAEKGDKLQLRNTSTTPIHIVSNLDVGNAVAETGASIKIIKL